MGLVEEIFSLLDDGRTTLVFPTENAARHYLSMYVRSRHSSVLADRAIALDSFMAKFAPVHKNRKPSNKYHRLAFVSSFLSSGKTGLRYIYDDRFCSFRRRFIPFLTRIIPDLMQMQLCTINNRILYSDLQTLKRQYGAFLDKNGLFEPGWEMHSLEFYKGPALDHVMVGIDADIQMQKLMKELGDVPGIRRLELRFPQKPVYVQYDTEEAELEALFHKLEKLKLAGIPTSEILIATPALSSLRQRLERKALEYNVPLSFMGSLDIFETVPGRYLSSVMLCITERLSFRSMEGLLLNSSLPYSNMDVNRTLIRFMIDNNIQSGSFDVKDDPLSSSLRKNGRTQELELYRTIKGALLSIRSSSDEQKLSKSLHTLTAHLFGTDEFNNSPSEDRDVYSFILSALSDLGKTLRNVSLDMDDMFSVFMDELEHLSYVPQDNKSGIRVYSYAQDPLLHVPYHFVIGLNDVNSQVRERYLGFLEDHEVVSDSFDVTQRLFEYYGQSGDKVFISGSKETFEGSAGAPTYFILNDSVKQAEVADSPVFEKADALSLRHAAETSFAPAGTDLATGGSGFERDPDSKALSFSTIDSYAKCPYMTFVEIDLLKDCPDQFEPARQDDREIGSFLHKVIQAFMNAHLGKLVVPQDLDEYHSELETIMNSLLEKESVFDPYMKMSIRGNYLEPLKNVLNILLLPPYNSKAKGYVGAFTPLRNEYRLNKNPSFIGYIDTIIMDNDGQIHLLDYKKGSGSPTYQLVLYKRLYDENPEFGENVGQCLFYSMGSSSFKSFTPDVWEQQSIKLDEDVENLRAGFREGRWTARPSKETCQFCEDRSICRRRFNLQ